MTSCVFAQNMRTPGIFSAETSVFIGKMGLTDGQITFMSLTDEKFVSLKAGAVTTSYTLTLPVADAEGFLFSDGLGVTSFAAASVTYENIGDPGASGSIAFGEYTGTYTSDNATWGGLIVQDSAAEIGAATLVTIDCSADSADADWTALKIEDATTTLFDFGGDGVLAFMNAESINNTTNGTIQITSDVVHATTDIDITATTGKIVLNGGAGDRDSYIHVETDTNGKVQFFRNGILCLELE